MKHQKLFIYLFTIVSLFVITSCKLGEKLPKPEHIPFNKSDYNGFYLLGENGKSFALIKNDSLTYKVVKEGFISINNIEKASVQFESYSNKSMISIKFNEKGSLAFRDITKKNKKKQIAVIFNNRLFMCPTIQEEISGGNVNITGNLSLQETVNIVNYINLNCQN